MRLTFCSNCGKEITRAYWQREFPDVLLCRECWTTPGIAPKTIRDSIAKALNQARKRGNRQLAKDVLKSLRGTGIPANPRRGRGKATRMD